MSKKTQLVKFPQKPFLDELWTIAIEYVGFLEDDLKRIVEMYFNGANDRFNEVENLIGNRWKSSMTDEEHVAYVKQRLTIPTIYYTGVRAEIDKYNTAERQLQDIMSFAPSVIYANSPHYRLWNDSYVGQNSSCSHLQLVYNYVKPAPRAILSKNVDDKKKDNIDENDDVVDENDDDGYTIDSDSDQHPGFHDTPNNGISITKAFSLLNQHVRDTSLVSLQNVQDIKNVYGCETKLLNSLVSDNITAVANAVPLNLQVGHLHSERESWRRRRRVYRNVAYHHLIHHLKPILLDAEDAQEIQTLFSTWGEFNPKDNCVKPDCLLDIRIQCKETQKCLLRIYLTQVRDDCAGC